MTYGELNSAMFQKILDKPKLMLVRILTDGKDYQIFGLIKKVIQCRKHRQS